MYKIENKPYGYYLTFEGNMDKAEMQEWVNESEKILQNEIRSRFGVFVDMRSLKPLDDTAKAKMEEGQKLFAQKGMQRSVVILSSSILTMQFKQIAKTTGIYQFERYINSFEHSNWEEVGIEWLINAKDPDKG